MRILQIDQRGKEVIRQLKSYAFRHKIDLESIKRMTSGTQCPVGNDANYSCYLHDGYRVVFSIEQQPIGWFRHISISVDSTEKLPSIPATEMIMKEFGFKGTVNDCDNVWIESDVPVIAVGLVNAINLIQQMDEEEVKKRYKKISIAPNVAIEQYDDIAEIFFKKIFDMNYSDILITDESSVTDFMNMFEDRRAEKEKVIEKIKEVYGIDVSDIKGLLLVQVFERIRILGK